MKTNDKLFDLATIYATLTHVEVIEILSELIEVREDLEDSLFLLKLDSTDMEARLNGIMAVEHQLVSLNKNIKTLEDAILCYESKIFEKRNINGGVVIFGLN